MTTSIAAEVDRRRAPPTRVRRTWFGDLHGELREKRSAATRIRWPSAKYRENPVGFFTEILGVDPWDRQVEVIEAIRDHPRVAISSGHKVSKSFTLAGIALWYYSSFKDARVVMSSTTARQVDQILWRELQMMRARGGKCLECKRRDPDDHEPRPCPHSAMIEGEIGMLARTGLKSADFREVVGFTAREAEAVAGISGRNLLYLIDEASGVPDIIFEAIEGNRAGGARIVLTSNPTRTTGEFFDAFHGKAKLYKTLRLSSEETPNVRSGEILVPGLATREWIDEKREEWGEDSPIYRVRVKGEFCLNEDGKIFSIHAIREAEQQWEDTSDAGRLFIGVDPAGASGTGDETVLAVRRGLKLLELVPKRGLDDDGHLALIQAVIGKHRLRRETPVVVIDREGPIGSSLYGRALAFVEDNLGVFEVVGVRSSDRAMRMPKVYDRQRDALTANLEQWFRDGGAIPEDTRLAAELHAPEWRQAINGRLKVTPKDELKKILGRSPDRYDALALSCWEPLSLRDGAGSTSDAARDAAGDEGHAGGMDPYAARATWRRR